MQKSIIAINSETSKQDLLLFLVSFTKKQQNKVFVDVESLPNFINSKVSFVVFNKSLRNYPKEIYWTSQDSKISKFLSGVDGILTIRHLDFKDLSTEKKQDQIGKLTYEDKHHLEAKSKSIESFLLPQKIDDEIGKDNAYVKNIEYSSDYNKEVEDLNIAKQDLEEEIISQNHDITFFQDNGVEETGQMFSNSKNIDGLLKKEGESKLQNLDLLIEKLEKTKLDLTKKGKYPLKVSELISMKYKPTWIERLIPLSSVSSSILFVLFLIVISFLILLNLFPLS